jgi:hypothetical protein
MKALAVGLVAAAIVATTAAQDVAHVDANATSAEAKQQIVKSTTEAQTAQMSGRGYHGPPPATEAGKLTVEQGQQVMSRIAKSAKDQYRPIMPPPRAAGDQSDYRTRPRMSDPDMQETIRRQQHS